MKGKDMDNWEEEYLQQKLKEYSEWKKTYRATTGKVIRFKVIL